MEPVTDKQFKVIRMIEENLDIKFNGHSKFEATLFISTNMERSKAAAAEHWSETQKLYQAEDYQERDEYSDEDYYRDLLTPGFLHY